mgnify:CR=1 FL=1
MNNENKITWKQVIAKFPMALSGWDGWKMQHPTKATFYVDSLGTLKAFSENGTHYAWCPGIPCDDEPDVNQPGTDCWSAV